ncbi:hypothetical protein GCM10009555_033310 [Acrocarpospora macrocephala]
MNLVSHATVTGTAAVVTAMSTARTTSRALACQAKENALAVVWTLSRIDFMEI